MKMFYTDALDKINQCNKYDILSVAYFLELSVVKFILQTLFKHIACLIMKYYTFR